MGVANGEPTLSTNHVALLDGQLPTLTARTIGTVVRAAATDEKLALGRNVYIRLVGSLSDVFKWIWST